MIVPSKEEFVRLAADHDVVPVAREVYADLATPISAFMSLAEGAEHAFLLESVLGGERLGRYSFLGVGDREVITARGAEVVVENGGVTGEHAQDPLRVVARKLDAGRVARVPGLPLFVGGAVGFLGYEATSGFERVPRHENDELDVPDMVFMMADIVVAFDHARRVMQVIAPVRPGGAPEAAYDAALKRIDSYLKRIDEGPRGAELGSVGAAAEVPLTAHSSREEYIASVEAGKEHIAAGDIFQIVLSQRFSAPYEGDGLDLYRVLRAVNPSPYMFYVRTREVTLVGSSPEPLVRVEDGTVLTRPLAGTRPRGVDAAEDGRLRADLLADEKERAEHVMLVDLGRNDLGRVSAPGTVKVDELMEVEYYSHVMHIVSNVTGVLAEGKDAFDALRATFPAGTVSGAPKVRAMELIAGLEPAARGPYAGTVGYFGLDGAMDMCITIRTIVLANGRAYLQSGAGIVADSNPELEFEECQHKARALHRALELAAGMYGEVSA
ncbi:MAG: anthranilate synthase component I [Actinobacteria bacterium HGW-Actinobacteria-1]|jgi:anthranilate synthase component 1|nr:MAG: anthranilate synthase component I [Actinobacteria bacterium HGW-Actinobacteria-1]